MVHTRFLLTHLADPLEALARMLRLLKPGGVIILQDVDFTGTFCHPHCAAYWRYVDLYTQTVRRRGGDPNIGQRLPGMLLGAGVETVQVNVVQPSPLETEVKLLNPLTVENIADSVLAEGLASKAELDELILELYEFSRHPNSVAATPRIVQAWGRRPQA